MKAIHEVDGAGLQWEVSCANKRAFELREGAETVASLTFQKSWGTLAIGETADGQWTFKRVGFLPPTITMRAAGSDENLAEFRPDRIGSSAEVEFASGSRFQWCHDKEQGHKWTMASADGAPLLHFKAHTWIYGEPIQLEIEAAARELPELTLLVLLGEYFLMLLSASQLGVMLGGVFVGVDPAVMPMV